LKLRHHAFHRGDQDAASAAAPDQLGKQDAGFERLAEADRIGD
jgi:hypothetical protein